MKLDASYLICDRPIPQTAVDRVQMTKFQPHSYVAGPGRRCVLWVAGCHRRCPGCFQPHFFDFRAGESMTIEHLATLILAVDGIDGLSISGGEPFEQSESLGKLCKVIRERSQLSILAYTGYRHEQLLTRKFADQVLLDQLDWLIDGEYREDQRGPYLWRGSANQRLINLRSDSPEQSTLCDQPGETESVQVVIESNQIVVGGFPGPDMENAFRESLARRGIVLSIAPKPNPDFQ